MCHPLSPFLLLFFHPKVQGLAGGTVSYSLPPSFCFSFLFHIFCKSFQRRKPGTRVNISVTHLWVKVILVDFGPEVIAWLL